MDNLALIASNPSALPSYSSIFSGTAFVQDTGQLISTTILPYAAGSEAVNPSINRQISQNWTLDPIMAPEKLEAMRAACQWVIGGPESVHKDSMTLLVSPANSPPGPERHFGVAERLEALPRGWLGVGCLKDVPCGACYKAHCGHTWVWVMPDGIKGLADFSLIVQAIARIPINSQTLFNFPPVYTPIVFLTSDPENPDNRIRFTVQAVVDQSGHLVTDVPYYPLRFDTLGADSNLRSVIGAAGVTAVPR
jgi:hypothetical protein